MEIQAGDRVRIIGGHFKDKPQSLGATVIKVKGKRAWLLADRGIARSINGIKINQLELVETAQ